LHAFMERQSKICDFRASVGIDEDVRGLQVAVHESLFGTAAKSRWIQGLS